MEVSYHPLWEAILQESIGKLISVDQQINMVLMEQQQTDTFKKINMNMEKLGKKLRGQNGTKPSVMQR